jgi:hypothetical protein
MELEEIRLEGVDWGNSCEHSKEHFVPINGLEFLE